MKGVVTLSRNVLVPGLLFLSTALLGAGYASAGDNNLFRALRKLTGSSCITRPAVTARR